MAARALLSSLMVRLSMIECKQKLQLMHARCVQYMISTRGDLMEPPDEPHILFFRLDIGEHTS